MADVKTAPYGSWVSPITSDLVVKDSISLKEVRVDPFHEDKVYWSEMQPEKGGRYIVCSLKEGDSNIVSHTPENYSCRTTVHEYGGGAFFVHKNRIYFSNFSDQRMYCQKLKNKDSNPVPITSEGKDWRYADGIIAVKKHIVCVREDHEVINQGAVEAENCLVSINWKSKQQTVLVSGANFYSTPRLSKSGVLAWVQWNHSSMPWDNTELWTGQLSPHGDSLVEGTTRKVAGGEGISVMLNKWSPDDKLLYISDKTNWWNLYMYRLDGETETNLCPREQEIGEPAWEFGGSPYSCNPTGNGDILIAQEEGLAILRPTASEPISIDTGFSSHSNLRFSYNGKVAYMIAGSSKKFPKIIKVEIDTGKVSVLRESNTIKIDPGYYSVPLKISWPTTNNATSHGYFYAPANKDYQGPHDGKPQLLVKVHGGPTAACSSVLDLKKQFLTSRGFALLDVNYRGSTGFGREYRDSLKKNWGISDIEDCCKGAQFLADAGKVDGNCLTIDGGSAGGFVALAALTFHNVFQAGASFYGICDLEALTKETHKFESHYTESLIGPYPEDKPVYEARSPIHHVDQLDAALVIFQGDEDKVVPPNQSQMMFDAVNEKGKPVAYKLFKGEQHGFRKAENIKFSLDGEFYFYSKVFGFEAPNIDVDLEIHNLDSK